MNVKHLLSLLAMVAGMNALHAEPYGGFSEADHALRLLQIVTLDSSDYETAKTVQAMVMANKAVRAGWQLINTGLVAKKGGLYEPFEMKEGLSHWEGLKTVSALADTASLGHDYAYFQKLHAFTQRSDMKVSLEKKGLWAGLVAASYLLSSKSFVDWANAVNSGAAGSIGTGIANYIAPLFAIAQRYLMWKEQQDRLEMLDKPVIQKEDTEHVIIIEENSTKTENVPAEAQEGPQQD